MRRKVFIGTAIFVVALFVIRMGHKEVKASAPISLSHPEVVSMARAAWEDRAAKKPDHRLITDSEAVRMIAEYSDKHKTESEARISAWMARHPEADRSDGNAAEAIYEFQFDDKSRVLLDRSSRMASGTYCVSYREFSPEGAIEQRTGMIFVGDDLIDSSGDRHYVFYPSYDENDGPSTPSELKEFAARWKRECRGTIAKDTTAYLF